MHNGILFGGIMYCKLNAIQDEANDERFIPISVDNQCNFNGKCGDCPKVKNMQRIDKTSETDMNFFEEYSRMRIENKVLKDENGKLKAEIYDAKKRLKDCAETMIVLMR